MVTSSSATARSRFILICTPEEFLARDPVERLLAVRRQIDLEREHWDQRSWIKIDSTVPGYREEMKKPVEYRNICGSAYCVAGWASVLAGDRFTDDLRATVFVPGRGLIYVEDRANELFNLSVSEGDILYEGDNTIDDIDEVILALTGRVA